MSEHNPVDVEAAIRECANRIGRGVKVCADAYSAFLDADRMYDRAYAHAYMQHDGPAHEKRYQAELETGAERAARDERDAAYKYADRQAKALEAELRAYQSIGASMRQMFSVAGRGEGA